jgi:glycosyltransferase involved in cell wall biosynthesis
MKNIIIVTYEFPSKLGGIGRYLFNLAYGLSNSKQYSVTVLTPKGQAKKCGNSIVIDKLGKGKLSDLITIFKLLWRLKAGMVIWGHSRTFLLAYLLMLIGLRFNFRSVVPLHGSEVLRAKRKSFYSWYFHKFLKQSAEIIPNSKFTKSLLRSDFQNRAAVIYPSVSEDFFDTETVIPNVRSDVFVFGTLSRLVKRKGHALVLQCLSELKNRYNFRYLIAGDGPELGSLQDQVVELGLTENVKFLGRLSDDRLLEFYDQLDVFIMLNKLEPDDVEGFGYTFVEAGARSVPALGGRNGGACEVIIDKRTGWLVDVEDRSEVLLVLERILSAHYDIAEYGNNAKQHYLSEFSVKAIFSKYDELFK